MTEIEMPKYKCHKEVWALKIKEVHAQFKLEGKTGAVPNGVVLTFEEKGYQPVFCEQGWVEKHNPEPGCYVVTYHDGYQSISPAHAFESGYTRI